MNFLKSRLREPSTWAGIGSMLATGAQAYVTRDPQAIVATMASLLAIVVPERKPQ